jgi:hypothetical protein
VPKRLPLKILLKFLRDFKIGITVRVLPGSRDEFITGYLIGTSFTGNAREINIVFLLILVDHDHMDQIFIELGLQVMLAHGTVKIDRIPGHHLEGRMFDTGIITDLRVQQNQSLFVLPVLGRQYDIIPDHQVAVAFRTNIILLHGYLPPIIVRYNLQYRRANVKTLA